MPPGKVIYKSQMHDSTLSDSEEEQEPRPGVISFKSFAVKPRAPVPYRRRIGSNLGSDSDGQSGPSSPAVAASPRNSHTEEDAKIGVDGNSDQPSLVMTVDRDSSGTGLIETHGRERKHSNSHDGNQFGGGHENKSHLHNERRKTSVEHLSQVVVPEEKPNRNLIGAIESGHSPKSSSHQRKAVHKNEAAAPSHHDVLDTSSSQSLKHDGPASARLDSHTASSPRHDLPGRAAANSKKHTKKVSSGRRDSLISLRDEIKEEGNEDRKKIVLLRRQLESIQHQIAEAKSKREKMKQDMMDKLKAETDEAVKQALDDAKNKRVSSISEDLPSGDVADLQSTLKAVKDRATAAANNLQSQLNTIEELKQQTSELEKSTAEKKKSIMDIINKHKEDLKLAQHEHESRVKEILSKIEKVTIAEVKEKWDRILEDEMRQQDELLLIARSEISKQFEVSIAELNSKLEADFVVKKNQEEEKIARSEQYLKSLRTEIANTDVQITAAYSALHRASEKEQRRKAEESNSKKSRQNEFEALRRRLKDLWTLSNTPPTQIRNFLDKATGLLPCQESVVDLYESHLNSLLEQMDRA
jgi:hypothetical protein